jgi:hypothetical protein
MEAIDFLEFAVPQDENYGAEVDGATAIRAKTEQRWERRAL